MARVQARPCDSCSLQLRKAATQRHTATPTSPSELLFVSLLVTGHQVPGLGLRLDTSKLDLSYQDTYQKELPDAYERLLLDVVQGDKRLFIR